MNSINLLLVLILGLVVGSDFLLGKFKKAKSDKLVAFNNEPINSLKKDKFYLKSSFLILITFSLLFVISFFIEFDLIIIKEYFDIPFSSQELVIFFSLIALYTVFSVNSVLVKIKIKRFFAREILYLSLNIILAGLFFSIHLFINSLYDDLLNEIKSVENNAVVIDDMTLYDQYYDIGNKFEKKYLINLGFQLKESTVYYSKYYDLLNEIKFFERHNNSDFEKNILDSTPTLAFVQSDLDLVTNYYPEKEIDVSKLYDRKETLLLENNFKWTGKLEANQTKKIINSKKSYIKGSFFNMNPDFLEMLIFVGFLAYGYRLIISIITLIFLLLKWSTNTYFKD